MWFKFINKHSTPVISALKRSASFESDSTIANRMKRLNEERKFKETLKLFDIYKEKHPRLLSGSIVTQALKACTKNGDLQRGMDIHHLVSSRDKTDLYILSSLIHFYSLLNFINQFSFLFYISSAQWSCPYC